MSLRERLVKGREKTEKNRKEKMEGWRKVLFGNVVGIGNKGKEFWRYIRDMILLVRL